MAMSVVREQPELLTSWKEIACYLGKGVRTVQRWEQQFALPVRRPNERVKGIVHATRHDLDKWLEAQWSHRAKGMPYAPAVNDTMELVRASIEHAIALRRTNSALLADVRTYVESLRHECRVMARNMTGTPPPPQRWTFSAGEVKYCN